MKKDVNQHFFTYRTFAIFIVGAFVGMTIKSMGTGQEGEQLLPHDSPDFPGWNRPFLNAGLSAFQIRALYLPVQ
jgi:hypothetical protein